MVGNSSISLKNSAELGKILEVLTICYELRLKGLSQETTLVFE